MLHLRQPISNVIGVLVLAALVVPPTVMAGGSSIRAQVMRSATAPVGGAVTQKELPGCSNPSEPFAGRSQGCSEWSVGDWAIFNGTVWSRGPRQTTSLDGTYDPKPVAGASRGPRQTVSLDGTFARGPRQSTSVDGTFINPVTGASSRVYRVCQRRAGADLWGSRVADRGPDFCADPTYNSALASTSGVMGYGWSFPYSMSVHIYRGTATITQENGSQVVFKRGTGTGAGGPQFSGPPRVIASFQQTSGGTYTLTRGSSRRTCPSYLLQSCDTFTFSKGRLSRISPAACKSKEVCGNGIVDITRDSAGRPTSVMSGGGSFLTFHYTGGHITSITGSDGTSEQFTYDSHGNLSSATDPNGHTTHFTYDASHRLTGERDPMGRTTHYLYDSSGRVKTVTDPLGHETTYRYNGSTHTTTVTSPEGRTAAFGYLQKQITDLTVGRTGSSPGAEWTFAYSPHTLAVTKIVDPQLHATGVLRDADGSTLSLTDPLGHKTTFTYSDTGRRSSVTDPMGVKTKFTYDENGNVLTMSTPNSDTRQVQTYAWTYDDVAHQGDMTSSIDPLGNETDFTYDSHGNLASVTDPLGNTWTYSTKKACFNKTDPRVAPRGGGSTADATITDPLGHTTSFTCDANGNLLTTTDATGATTTNTYDADDELVSTTDPAGRMKKFFYTGTGRISAVRMPDGSTSHATYGADGELLTTVDPAGGTRSFTYDALGRTATDTDQLGRKTTFAYDAVGNLTSTTDAAGVTSTNTYDADNRVLKTRFENGDIPTENDFVYDLDGRRISMTDATGTTTYQYDSLGQLTLQRLGGDIVVHGYDLAGNRTSLQYANGHTVTTQYDGNGQMTRATDWLGNTTKFQYDDAARLIGLKVYDATKTYTVGDTAVYNTSLYRNAANQIIHIQARDAYGNAVASFDYTRAPDGAITSAESTGLGDPHHAYDYDLRARLGSYDGSPVTFDSRNNVTRLPDGSTLSYDAADQLTSMQSPVLLSTFTQDADGNRTASSSPGSVHSYGWNSAGDLTSFTSNGATTTYVLNGDGLRIQAQAPNGTHHTLVWDSAHDLGHNFGCSHDSTGNPACGRGIITNSGTGGGPPRLLTDGTNSFIYGPGGMPIEQIDNNGNALFLGTDAQGSVRLLTDASGNVKGTASYDAFGNRSSMAGESSAFGYHGMYLDSESGLYALGGGVYDPATGQSISKTKLTASEITHLLGQNSQSLRKFGDCWNCTPLPTASQNSQSLRKFGDCWNCTPIVTAGQNGQSLRSAYYFSTNPSQNSQSLRALSPYAVDGGDPVNGSVGAADVYFNPKEYTIDK